jgi:hypothetical protein
MTLISVIFRLKGRGQSLTHRVSPADSHCVRDRPMAPISADERSMHREYWGDPEHLGVGLKANIQIQPMFRTQETITIHRSDQNVPTPRHRVAQVFADEMRRDDDE